MQKPESHEVGERNDERSKWLFSDLGAPVFLRSLAVCEVAQSRTLLKWLSSSSSTFCSRKILLCFQTTAPHGQGGCVREGWGEWLVGNTKSAKKYFDKYIFKVQREFFLPDILICFPVISTRFKKDAFFLLLFYFILQLFFLCSLLNISTHLLSRQGNSSFLKKFHQLERDRYKLLRVTEHMTHDTTNGFCTRQEGRLSLCCVVLICSLMPDSWWSHGL